MKCPACGTDGAYVGLKAVECRSASCRHYAAPAGTPASLKDCGHDMWGQLPVVSLMINEKCTRYGCGLRRRCTAVSKILQNAGILHDVWEYYR